MFYVPKSHQITIPADLKILIQTSTSKNEQNNAKVMFLRNGKKQKIWQEQKKTNLKTQRVEYQARQQQNRKSLQKKLPAICPSHCIKLGVKGRLATNQIMPLLRKIQQQQNLQSQIRHARLKSQCSYLRAPVRRYHSINIKQQLSYEQPNKNDPNKIAPWQVKKLTRFSFYQQ